MWLEYLVIAVVFVVVAREVIAHIAWDQGSRRAWVITSIGALVVVGLLCNGHISRENCAEELVARDGYASQQDCPGWDDSGETFGF